eukprot:GHVN01066201.1.p1 GENE.GHVN01066201.1~~GHVN01066201.1.p1  ORF type:complete len:106 (+),score=11.30 GHVN01066201.1:142-459(+)
MKVGSLRWSSPAAMFRTLRVNFASMSQLETDGSIADMKKIQNIPAKRRVPKQSFCEAAECFFLSCSLISSRQDTSLISSSSSILGGGSSTYPSVVQLKQPHNSTK